MARAVQMKPDLVRFILTSKACLAEGKKDDIKNIWDTVGLVQFVIYQSTSDVGIPSKGSYYHVTKPDDDWERLEQILEMSEAEFTAWIEEALEEDVEEEEEEEEEGKEEEEEEEWDPGTGEEDE